MKKSFLTTLLLLGVFAFLVGWYFLYEKKYKVEQAATEEKGKSLVSYEQKDVKSFYIERLKNPAPEGTIGSPSQPDIEKISLKKVGEDWELLTPLEDKADKATVDTVLNALFGAKYERIVEEAPKDLDTFGLKIPVVKITIKKEDAASGETVLFGNHTAVGQGTYAQIAGKPTVYRLPRWIRGTLEKDGASYRNKQVLLGVNRNDITEIELIAGKETTLLKKEQGREQWMLARENAPASGDEVNKSLNAVVDLKAHAFPDTQKKSLADFGLKPPKVRVTLLKADNARLTVLLGQTKDKKAYAKREDKETIFEVPAEAIEKLSRASSAYRDNSLALFNRFNVKRVKLEAKGQVVAELLRDEGKWSDPSDPKAQIDEKKVDLLLTKLQDTKVLRFLPKSTPKLSDPVLTLRISEAGKDKVENEKVVLKFGTERRKEHVVERSDLGTPFALTADDFKSINLEKKNFIKTEKVEEKKNTKS